jgi:hypothetical protein
VEGRQRDQRQHQQPGGAADGQRALAQRRQGGQRERAEAQGLPEAAAQAGIGTVVLDVHGATP